MCYIWVLVNKSEKVAIFFYEKGSRSRDVLTDFLGDSELKSIMSDGYNAYVFIGNELKSAQFKATVHQVCMSHACNKFVKASNQGKEDHAALFAADLKELFRNERKYDEARLTPEERLKERQSLATKEILIRIRSRLDGELATDSEYRSQYYTEALNYLNHFWDEIFAYLKAGEFPIDNNLAGVSRGHYNMMLLAGIMEILSATIKEMRVGPSQSVYRNRLQTITSCVLSNQKVVNVVCNKSEDMVRYV